MFGGIKSLVKKTSSAMGDIADQQRSDFGISPSVRQKAAEATAAKTTTPATAATQTFGTQNVLGSDIANFITANAGDAQKIADAARDFGLTAADIEAASGISPTQQAQYLKDTGVSGTGIVGLPLATTPKATETAAPVKTTTVEDLRSLRDQAKTTLNDLKKRYGSNSDEAKAARDAYNVAQTNVVNFKSNKPLLDYTPYTEPAPPEQLWSYTGDKDTFRTNTDEDKINKILESWKSTGELTPMQETQLLTLSDRYGTNFIDTFREFQKAAETPTTDYSIYEKPTQYAQDITSILGLTGVEEANLDRIISKYSSGQTLSTKELKQLQDYATRGALGTAEDVLAQEFAPSATNRFAKLNYEEEQKLAILAEKYASGEASDKQVKNLNELLDRAGLGTVESYFARPTYTNIEDYESLFGEGEIIGESQAKAPSGEVTEGNIWTFGEGELNPAIERDTEKINSILKTWQQEGEISPAQKLELRRYSEQYNTDFLTEYKNFQTQATPIDEILREFDRLAETSPFKATQYAKSMGLEPNEVEALLQGYGTQQSYYRPVYTKQELADLFTKGEEQGKEEVFNYLTATFGDKDDVQVLADTLNNSYLTQVASSLNNTFKTELTSADLKDLGNEVLKLGDKALDNESIASLKTFVKDKYDVALNDAQTKNIAEYLSGSLQSADSIYDMYSYENLEDMSHREMQNFIETSSLNKLQEAGTLSGILSNVFNFDSDDIRGILKDVTSTGATQYDAEFKRIYQSLLRNNEIDDALQTRILTAAARLAPDSQYWKKQYDDKGNLIHDGELLYAGYTNPITKTIYNDDYMGANQYGTYNDAPVLNAKSLEQSFDGDKSGTLNVHKVDRKGLGWDFGSRQGYSGTEARRGLDAIGIDTMLFGQQQAQTYDSIYDNKMAKAEEYGFRTTGDYGEKGAEGSYFAGYQTDPEGGRYATFVHPENDALNAIRYSTQSGGDGGDYQVDNFGGKDYIEKLKDSAKQLGIDEYSSLTDLYNKVEDATKDLYMVIGGADKGRFTDTDGKNHAAVMYRKVGDKLLAINDPTYFKYEAPKKSWATKTFGNAIGGIFDFVAEIPLVAEAAYLIAVVSSGGTATPGANAMYAGLKASQAAGTPGSSIGDVLKAGGLAYLTTEVIPTDIAPGMADTIAGLPGIKDLPKGWQTFVSKAGTNAVVASGIAGITNQDMGDAFLNALSTSAIKGIGGGVMTALENSELGTNFADVVDEFTKTAEDLIQTGGNEQFSFKNIDPRFKDMVQNIVIDTMFFDKEFDDAVKSGITRLALSGLKTKGKSLKEKTATA